MKKLLSVALLFGAASLGLGQSAGDQDQPLTDQAIPGPSSLTSLVDYTTSQSAGTILSAPCASSGPPLFITMCAESVEAMAAGLSTVTADSADTFLLFDASDAGHLKLGTISDIGTSAGASITTPQSDVCSDVSTAHSFSFTVPGGTLGTGSGYILDLIEYFNNGGGTAADGIDISVSYGGTILAEDVLVTSVSTTRKITPIRVIVTGYGATNQQYAEACAEVNAANSATVGFGALDTAPSTGWRCIATDWNSLPAAVDSTANQTLAVNIKNTFNGATNCNKIVWAKATRSN